MPRKNVTSKSKRRIVEVQDALGDVKDGLVRIFAIADLLQDASEYENDETVRGAAEAICLEVDSLRILVGDASEDLDVIKQRQPAAVPLEVVEGGAS